MEERIYRNFIIENFNQNKVCEELKKVFIKKGIKSVVENNSLVAKLMEANITVNFLPHNLTDLCSYTMEGIVKFPLVAYTKVSKEILQILLEFEPKKNKSHYMDYPGALKRCALKELTEIEKKT